MNFPQPIDEQFAKQRCRDVMRKDAFDIGKLTNTAYINSSSVMELLGKLRLLHPSR